MDKKKHYRKLSPSRIGTLSKCTWSYWCNYHLKLPDTGNDGSRRGSIIHDLYECLIEHIDRHRWKYDMILEKGDAYAVPCVERFIRMKARQYELELEKMVVTKNKKALISNRDYLNEMILVGLQTPFYGLGDGEEIISELAHTLDVDRPEEGIRYIARGFIDKIFIRRDESGKIIEVEIIDYKSSKMKFSGDDLKFNMQGVIYQLFARDLYPETKKLFFNFLFLQFPRNPWQSVSPLPDKMVKGVEVYLTDLFHKINNFTEQDAKSYFAKHHGMKHFCGKRGMKTFDDKDLGRVPSPEKNWMCPHKEPYDYYALVDKDGDVKKTARTEEELTPTDDLRIIKKHYAGCPAWYASKKDLKKFWGAIS